MKKRIEKLEMWSRLSRPEMGLHKNVSNERRTQKKDLRQKHLNELKRKIAKAYERGQYSYGALAEEYSLKDKMVVKEFVKWYHRQPELVVEDSINDLAHMKQRDSNLSAEQLRAELDEPQSSPSAKWRTAKTLVNELKKCQQPLFFTSSTPQAPSKILRNF